MSDELTLKIFLAVGIKRKANFKNRSVFEMIRIISSMCAFVCFNAFCFCLLQDSVTALALDLNHPALRKNKNIDSFLNRCKSL